MRGIKQSGMKWQISRTTARFFKPAAAGDSTFGQGGRQEPTTLAARWNASLVAAMGIVQGHVDEAEAEGGLTATHHAVDRKLVAEVFEKLILHICSPLNATPTGCPAGQPENSGLQ